MRFPKIIVCCVVLAGCSEPRLRSELAGEPDPPAEQVDGGAATDSIEAKRKAVIGQSFESLTLGDRRFSRAEIRDITDEDIVVAHAEGLDRIPWTEVPEKVRNEWGYDPSKKTLKDRLVDALPGISNKGDGKEEEAPPETVRPTVVEPEMSLAERARLLAQKEQMLEAQLEGIRTLESDLSRHTVSLNTLRAELQAVRAIQSSQRSGGIRVERIGGESTLVDRKKQAREIEAKLKVEEQLVAQLSQSLQKARQQYQALNAELIRLRQ